MYNSLKPLICVGFKAQLPESLGVQCLISLLQFPVPLIIFLIKSHGVSLWKGKKKEK